MRNREEVIQIILGWGKDGKEIDIVELAKVEGLVNEKEIKDKLIRNSVMQRIRATVHRAFAREGKKVRSIRKNVYRVIDETSVNECHEELLRLVKAASMAQRKVSQYKRQMREWGHPVQEEIIVLRLEGGEDDAKDAKANKIRPVARASQKPKKASNS